MTKTMFHTLPARSWILAPLLAFASAAWSQPDAGQLLNQQQRLDQQSARKAEARDNAPEGLPADTAGGFRARIASVRFSGAEGLLTPGELQAAVADVIDNELTHAQLQALAARITGLLQRSGWPLARAYLPRQDLTAGALEIAVLQGRLESGPQRLQIANNSGVASAWLRAIADAALPADTLRTDDLERALLLMNDLAGVTARARLERGSEPGTSRLVISAEASPQWLAQASLDNFLNRYVGTARANVRLAWANPTAVGDGLALSLNLSEGSQGLSASYTRLLTPMGLRLNLGASTLTYKLGQELKPLELEGRASSFTGGLGYALVRSRAANAWVAADLESRELRDDSLVGNLRHRRVQRLQISFYGNRSDALGLGGGTDWSLAAVTGRVNLDGNANDAALDLRTAGTQGTFHKLALQLSHLQSLSDGGDWSTFAGLSAQMAEKNLDSSEKFQLGGPSGVRAYAVGEASGDTGWLATAELRREFMASPQVRGQALVFIDAGGITQHKQIWSGALPAGRDNNVGLSGIGIGLNLYSQGWQLRSALARATGSNAALQPDGRDADGRTSRTRAWLQASTSF